MADDDWLRAAGRLGVSRDRRLVIDADLGKRLAARITDRGRAAIYTGALGLAVDVKDPDLLRGLVAHYGQGADWVLVTGDDKMPAEHGPVIRETRATVATIDPEFPDGVLEFEWRTDIVQRWAHAMQKQAPQTVRRYGETGSKIWRPRRRHARLIREYGWTPWRHADGEGR